MLSTLARLTVSNEPEGTLRCNIPKTPIAQLKVLQAK